MGHCSSRGTQIYSSFLTLWANKNSVAFWILLQDLNETWVLEDRDEDKWKATRSIPRVVRLKGCLKEQGKKSLSVWSLAYRWRLPKSTVHNLLHIRLTRNVDIFLTKRKNSCCALWICHRQENNEPIRDQQSLRRGFLEFVSFLKAFLASNNCFRSENTWSWREQRLIHLVVLENGGGTFKKRHPEVAKCSCKKLNLTRKWAEENWSR